MTSVVLDASALIAVLAGEPGAEVVRPRLGEAFISAVNYSEIIKKTLERGGSAEAASIFIQSALVTVVPFGEKLAIASATLYPLTKHLGLSFADRACLALGVAMKYPVLTTERKMSQVELSVPVTLIRGGH